VQRSVEQSIKTRLRFTRTTPAGEEVERKESWWKTRYLYQYEAVHLLARCGLDVESIVGDYNSGPVTTKSQLIFQVKLSE